MMKFMLVATTILHLLLFCASEDIAFECKPKPGCNLSSCIDIPSGLRELSGFDENYYRMKNDYHLECKPKGVPSHYEDRRPTTKFVPAEKFTEFKEKVNKEFKALNKKYKELKKLLNVAVQSGSAPHTVSTSSSTRPTSSSDACTGVFHECKCFILVEDELSYGRSHFEAECIEMGGHLANVYSAEHYEKLATYVRQKVGEKTGNAPVHLGMKYSHKGGGPLFYDGTTADYDIVWVPGYPKENDESDGMLMYVDMEPDESFQGIFNFMSTNPHPRAMCEI